MNAFVNTFDEKNWILCPKCEEFTPVLSFIIKDNLLKIKSVCSCSLEPNIMDIQDFIPKVIKAPQSQTNRKPISEEKCFTHQDVSAESYCDICTQTLCKTCTETHKQNKPKHLLWSFKASILKKCTLHNITATVINPQTQKWACKDCTDEVKNTQNQSLVDYWRSVKQKKEIHSKHDVTEWFEEGINKIRKKTLKQIKEIDDVMKELSELKNQIKQGSDKCIEDNKKIKEIILHIFNNITISKKYPNMSWIESIQQLNYETIDSEFMKFKKNYQFVPFVDNIKSLIKSYDSCFIIKPDSDEPENKKKENISDCSLINNNGNNIFSSGSLFGVKNTWNASNNTWFPNYLSK